MKIKVHYQGLDSNFDEWINVFKNIDVAEGIKASISLKSYPWFQSKIKSNEYTSLCGCGKMCYVSNILTKEYGCHRFTLPKSRSLRYKDTKGLNCVYSKSHKKLIILGQNDTIFGGGTRVWSGLYYKRIDRDENCKYYQLIVDGFIHQFENIVKCTNIPKDLNKIIVEYYFIPDDHEWTQATKADKDGKFIRDMYNDCFKSHSGCVCVNNDNDIFLFGGGVKGKMKTNDILRLNIETNKLEYLTNIKCPGSCDLFAVFCTKSQKIHLFARNFCLHASISLKTLNNASSVVIDE